MTVFTMVTDGLSLWLPFRVVIAEEPTVENVTPA